MVATISGGVVVGFFGGFCWGLGEGGLWGSGVF